MSRLLFLSVLILALATGVFAQGKGHGGGTGGGRGSGGGPPSGVGVDRGYAQRREDRPHVTLARSDTAREGDALHLCGHVVSI